MTTGIANPPHRHTEPSETLYVSEHRISCDGGGTLGHPRVFLEMGPDGKVECPYCDRLFVLKHGADGETDH